MAQLICIYVGQASEVNLGHGIRNGIWGFKENVSRELASSFNFDDNSYVLLASGFTGGSPRVQSDKWISHNVARIYLAKISSGLFTEDRPEWPDEEADGKAIYPVRFRFDKETLLTYKNIPLKNLPFEISDHLRSSAIANSRGHLISNINIKNLKQDLTGMIEEILNAVQSDLVQNELNAEVFHFEKAQNSLSDFDLMKESSAGIYLGLFNNFAKANKTYTNFIKELKKDSEEYIILHKIGELVSYCDLNAANKNELNGYDDKRTLARSFVRQTDWVKSLLSYKINNNDINVLPPSIKNAINYLKNPSGELTMLSENHREMVSRNLLEQNSYKKESFVQNVIDFFKPYKIEPNNSKNLTRIISDILYRFKDVKKLWLEKLEGLVVCDKMTWIEDAIKAKSQSKNIVLWWDKSPSGGPQVIKLLKDALQSSDAHCFYIYYSTNQTAQYRAKIIDYAFEDEYNEKNWDVNNDVAWYYPNFSEYMDTRDNGGSRFAKIVFLAAEIEKLQKPIKMEYFDFYNGHSAPTQNNMQPFTQLNYEISIDDDGNSSSNSMTPKEILLHVLEYISAKGFRYKYEEIANFYLSLKSKPFVILAGISGTGKTQLPRKFASAIGMTKDQIMQIPVRPDWTDGSDLLGYVGLDGKFKPKDLTIAIMNAYKNPEIPYFFILDEMNLARVEHYFSDFLSVIETREWKDGTINTDPILRDEALKSAENRSDFKALGWPQNLYLIGTVNMDETTHAFSRKVLDRANSIEMNEVDLDWIHSSAEIVYPLKGINNSFFITPFLGSIDLSDEDKTAIIEEMELLKQVNQILEEADLHFAYRVRDEVAFYLILNNKYDLMDSNSAMDFQLVQKVLPRIHGSSDRVQTVLVKLLNLLEGKNFKINGFEYSDIDGSIETDNLKYKRASKKILFMLKRFDNDRFTSFWL